MKTKELAKGWLVGNVVQTYIFRGVKIDNVNCEKKNTTQSGRGERSP